MRRVVPFSVAGVTLGMLMGCPRDPVSPRHVARGAVLAVAHATRVADHVCAAEAKARIADIDVSIRLATRCAEGYDVARKALEAAAYAVDAWGAAEDTGAAVCAVSEGAAGLRMMVAALNAAGVVALPAEVHDGLAAAAWMAGVVVGGKCTVRK